MTNRYNDNESFVAMPLARPATIDTSGNYVDIEIDKVAREAFTQNAAMLTAYLGAIQPRVGMAQPAPTVTTQSLSSLEELQARTARFKFSVGAIVAIAGVTAAGIVGIAWRAGVLDNVGAVVTWPAVAGMLSGALVWAMHRHDANLSPEGLEAKRIDYDAIVAQTDATSRQIVAEAFAFGIRADAKAKAYTQRANADALFAQTQQLVARKPQQQQAAQRYLRPLPNRASEEVTRAAIQRGEQMELRPRIRHADTVAPTVEGTVQSTVPTVQPTVNPVRTTVLEFLAGLYEDADAVDASGRIARTVPWSARGVLAQTDSDKVKRAIGQISPPVFETGAGNRWQLNLMYEREHAITAVAGALDSVL